MLINNYDHLAFYAAGMEPWDVNMRDLLSRAIEVGVFRGIVFCGGFSYADVNDSAKGWAGVIRFNEKLLKQFEAFKNRQDTFSLGICNGCQLMALLGWVPFTNLKNEVEQPRFIHNESGRFESRWVGLKILPSPAVLLKSIHIISLNIIIVLTDSAIARYGGIHSRCMGCTR